MTRNQSFTGAVRLFLLMILFHMCTGKNQHVFLKNKNTQQVKQGEGNEVKMHSETGRLEPLSLSPENGALTEKIGYFNLTFGHAESPTWDPKTKTLYWVDVLKQRVHSLNFITLTHRDRYLGCGEVNVVIPVANSSQLVIGCQSKVFLFNWKTSVLKEIAHLDSHTDLNIFNEGRCDALGRLWAGTKGPQIGDTVQPNRGALYKLEGPCYKPNMQLMSVTISNGLVWSLNNSLLYYIDSATDKIEAFDYNLKKGMLGKRRTILDTTEWGFIDPVPDGMTIDRDGFLWIALFNYGEVIRVNPDTGDIVSIYELPVPRVTSMAWAGDTLEDLVVTTSRRNLRDEDIAVAPLSGTIFLLSGLSTGGVPDNKCVYRATNYDACISIIQ